MKKILCPVDFSFASRGGIAYAAHLAQTLHFGITLYHVRTTIWPEARQLDDLAAISDAGIQTQLNALQKELQDVYHLTCEAYFEPSTDTLEAIIARQAKHHELIVMGTHRPDSFFRQFYGSNTYHVIDTCKCPVIIVPQGCEYRPLTLIVYAYNQDTNPLFLVEQLKMLTVPLDCHVQVLHVEENPAPDSKHKMEILKEAIHARESKHLKLSFDFQYAEEVSFALDTYMHVHHAGMLALSVNHRSLLDNLFTENVIKEMSRQAGYPVFVFWY